MWFHHFPFLFERVIPSLIPDDHVDQLNYFVLESAIRYSLGVDGVDAPSFHGTGSS